MRGMTPQMVKTLTTLFIKSLMVMTFSSKRNRFSISKHKSPKINLLEGFKKKIQELCPLSWDHRSFHQIITQRAEIKTKTIQYFKRQGQTQRLSLKKHCLEFQIWIKIRINLSQIKKKTINRLKMKII